MCVCTCDVVCVCMCDVVCVCMCDVVCVCMCDGCVVYVCVMLCVYVCVMLCVYRAHRVLRSSVGRFCILLLQRTSISESVNVPVHVSEACLYLRTGVHMYMSRLAAHSLTFHRVATAHTYTKRHLYKQDACTFTEHQDSRHAHAYLANIKIADTRMHTSRTSR